MRGWDTGTPTWPGSGTYKCPILKKKKKVTESMSIYDLGPVARTVTRQFVQPLAMDILSFVIQNLFYTLGTYFSSSQTSCECSNKSRMFPINYAGGNQKLFRVNRASGPAGSFSGVGFNWEWRQSESHMEMVTTSCMHSELEIPINSFPGLMLKPEYQCF